MNVHYGLKEDSVAGTLVHFLAEVCPRTHPFSRDSAIATGEKKHAAMLDDQVEASLPPQDPH